MTDGTLAILGIRPALGRGFSRGKTTPFGGPMTRDCAPTSIGSVSLAANPSAIGQSLDR